MTLFYWSNNLRASFLALGLGMLGGVPALLTIAFNGAVLGAVAAVATERGVGHRLWSGSRRTACRSCRLSSSAAASA